jgi:hypothetical protein
VKSEMDTALSSRERELLVKMTGLLWKIKVVDADAFFDAIVSR